MSNRNTMNTVESTGDDLVQAMNRIRNESEHQVLRLHEQAQRLSDWREYVRSRPVLAVGLALAGGYLLMHRSCPKRSATVTVEQPKRDRAASKVTRTSLVSGAMAFVGSLASQAIKYYAMNQIRNRMGLNHEQAVGFGSEATGFSDSHGQNTATRSPTRRNGLQR